MNDATYDTSWDCAARLAGLGLDRYSQRRYLGILSEGEAKMHHPIHFVTVVPTTPAVHVLVLTSAPIILLGVLFCAWQFLCCSVAETIRRRKTR